MNVCSWLLGALLIGSCTGEFRVAQLDRNYFRAYVYVELLSCATDSSYSVLIPKADSLTWAGLEVGSTYTLSLHPMDYAIMNSGDTLYRRNADQPFWFYNDGHKSLRITDFFHAISFVPNRVDNCPPSAR